MLNCDTNTQIPPVVLDYNINSPLSSPKRAAQTVFTQAPTDEEYDSAFETITKEANDLIEAELSIINESTKLCNHKMVVCDPAYDGHHQMGYYDDLWAGLKWIKKNCKNKGLSFGQLIKKKIKVHYCKYSENYGGINRCNHVICDHCMEKEEQSEGGTGTRRSKRRRT